MNRLFFGIICLFSLVFQIQAAEQGGNKNMSANGRNLVILIHGFHKGAVDMQFWKKHLSMENTDVLTPNLPTVFQSFERCLRCYCRKGAGKIFCCLHRRSQYGRFACKGISAKKQTAECEASGVCRDSACRIETCGYRPDDPRCGKNLEAAARLETCRKKEADHSGYSRFGNRRDRQHQ